MENSQEKVHYFDYYPIEPPFSYVGIRYFKGSYIYEVIEPLLTNEERIILERIKRGIYEEVDFTHEENLEEELKKHSLKLIKKYKIKIEEYQFDKIFYYIRRDMLKYGKITVPYLDPYVEDISCDGIHSPVYVYHKKYESIPTNIKFDDINELINFVIRLANKGKTSISSSNPIVDATLPEGYRANLTLTDVSKKGPTFTIRKFFIKPITIIDLIISGVITPRISAYLWILIENLKAILIIGSTGAGKTTTLNAIATFIPPTAKIVTIEETREINLPHQNWIPLTTRTTTQEGIKEISMFELLKASLRQRPNYIIVGEVRGEEAYTLAQAIAVGHGGLTTFHAENEEYTVYRLINEPLNVPPALLPMISTIVKVAKVKEGNVIKRKITDISEVLGYDEKEKKPLLNKVYKWSPYEKNDIDIKNSIHINALREAGVYENIYEEIENRIKILEWLANRGFSDFKIVSKIISAYYNNPKRILLAALANSSSFEIG